MAEPMRTPPQLVWLAHGSPAVEGCVPASGRCYLCAGVVEHGAPVSKWLTSGFGDYARVALPYATHVCAACVYVCSRVSPVLYRPPGACSACDGTAVIVTPRKGERAGDPCLKCAGVGLNANGGNFRNVSHLYDPDWDPPARVLSDEAAQLYARAQQALGDHPHAGIWFSAPRKGYMNASKGDKQIIRAFIEREKPGIWFAAIADSGQKHVLPFARLNGRGRSGVVLLDDLQVSVPDDVSLIGGIADALTAKITKEEIETGDYTIHTMRYRREIAMAFEERFSRARGSSWFVLALWLAQREEVEEESATADTEEGNAEGRKVQKGSRGARDRDAPRDQRRVSAKSRRASADGLLATDPEPVPSSGGAELERERVGLDDAARAPDPGVQQLGLKGIA